MLARLMLLERKEHVYGRIEERDRKIESEKEREKKRERERD